MIFYLGNKYFQNYSIIKTCPVTLNLPKGYKWDCGVPCLNQTQFKSIESLPNSKLTYWISKFNLKIRLLNSFQKPLSEH